MKHAIRRLLARTRWARERRRRDPFLVTQDLVRNPQAVIFDVGAHVGETAARYRALFPNATIHSFEPSPASFERLAGALRVDERAVAHHLAVSDSTGSATLHVNRAAVTNSLLPSDGRGANYWGSGLLDTEAEVTVNTVSLDDFCARQRIEHVDVLKVDVQGAEYAVLAGAGGLLARRAVDLIYMELIFAPSYVGQRKYHEYFASLETLGYVLFDLFDLGRRDGRVIQADGIFVSDRFLERYESERLRERKARGKA